MKDGKQDKHESVKAQLDKLFIDYTEYPNGQLKVDTVNLWTTTEKWYDEELKMGGRGVNDFIVHLGCKYI